MYWGDEVSIWLNKHECGKLMCWFEKHDVHGMPPADNMLCDREGSVRLDVLLVVNARRGLVWVEFLTGTKDLEQDGRHNAQMRECMRLRELSYKGVKGSENFKLGCYKTKGSSYSTPAQRATAWEIGDNLLCGYLPARMQDYQAGREPMISLDNARIHNVSPMYIDLTRDRLELPPRSFDLNQPIEHCFGGLKHYLIAECYRLGWDRVKAEGAKLLRKIVVDYCTTKITPEGVKADCARLKCLYKIVACPTDQYVDVTEPGHQRSSRVQGTGGGYPSKRWR